MQFLVLRREENGETHTERCRRECQVQVEAESE
jgi:hypothetical protein